MMVSLRTPGTYLLRIFLWFQIDQIIYYKQLVGYVLLGADRIASRAGILYIIGVTATVISMFTIGLIHNISAQKAYVANLSGKNEVPPTDSKSTGVAKFQESLNGQRIDYQVILANISGVMGAHIHIGKQGQNGPVVAGLFNSNMSGPPTGKVNGLLAKGTIKQSDLQGPLTGHPMDDLDHLLASHGAYVNIHTQQHQNGEIRGQIS
jgi:hypothetical protein